MIFSDQIGGWWWGWGEFGSRGIIDQTTGKRVFTVHVTRHNIEENWKKKKKKEDE